MANVNATELECVHCGDVIRVPQAGASRACPSCGEPIELVEPDLANRDNLERKETVRFRRPPRPR